MKLNDMSRSQWEGRGARRYLPARVGAGNVIPSESSVLRLHSQSARTGYLLAKFQADCGTEECDTTMNTVF